MLYMLCYIIVYMCGLTPLTSVQVEQVQVVQVVQVSTSTVLSRDSW